MIKLTRFWKYNTIPT